ncbi:hypothetical protein [Streptomyces sp. NPDC052036]|uniref:hypothetical protein n=1 Tax=unclassified Streptomyces TaxID=2593676 RepID=UPI00343CFD44
MYSGGPGVREALENLRRLREAWSRLLNGTVTYANEIATVISTLQRIETQLSQNSDGPGKLR